MVKVLPRFRLSSLKQTNQNCVNLIIQPVADVKIVRRMLYRME
jgi:hypothetical protein